MMKMKNAAPATRKAAVTIKSINFVTVMAILNAIVQRFKDDTVKTNLAALAQPVVGSVAVDEAIATDSRAS
jgi:hypothetical protein